MSTWYQEVHTLVQKCLDSADEVLTEVEKNCEGNLTIEFIDEFFKLLAKKFAHVSGNHKWEWEAKIANKSLTHKAVNHNNNMLPLDAFDVTPLMASTPANNAVARTLSAEKVRSPTSTTVSPPQAMHRPNVPANATYSIQTDYGTPERVRATAPVVATSSWNPPPSPPPSFISAPSPKAIPSTSSNGSGKDTASPARRLAPAMPPPALAIRTETNGHESRATAARATRAPKRKLSPPPKEAAKPKRPGKASGAAKRGRKPGKATQEVEPAPVKAPMSTPDLDESAENVSTLNSITYYCAHCHQQYDDVRQFDTVAKVHEHWQQRHESEDNAMPFRYYAVDMVACYHCDFIGVYKAVKEHHAEDHPQEQFAVVSLSDDIKCALCAFKTVDMIDHFKERHKAVLHTNDFNPTAMSDRCLSELLETNEGTRFTCSACSRCFDTDNLTAAHINRSHTGTAAFSSPVKCCGIRKVIVPCCDHIETPQDQLLKHLQSHQRDYKCPECAFVAANMHEIAAHYSAAHATLPPMDLNAHVKQILLADYLATKVVFANGLVVSKQNLLNTKYDDSHEFNEFLQNFIHVKREMMNDAADEAPNASAMVVYMHH